MKFCLQKYAQCYILYTGEGLFLMKYQKERKNEAKNVPIRRIEHCRYQGKIRCRSQENFISQDNTGVDNEIFYGRTKGSIGKIEIREAQARDVISEADLPIIKVGKLLRFSISLVIPIQLIVSVLPFLSYSAPAVLQKTPSKYRCNPVPECLGLH